MNPGSIGEIFIVLSYYGVWDRGKLVIVEGYSRMLDVASPGAELDEVLGITIVIFALLLADDPLLAIVADGEVVLVTLIVPGLESHQFVVIILIEIAEVGVSRNVGEVGVGLGHRDR